MSCGKLFYVGLLILDGLVGTNVHCYPTLAFHLHFHSMTKVSVFYQVKLFNWCFTYHVLATVTFHSADQDAPDQPFH